MKCSTRHGNQTPYHPNQPYRLNILGTRLSSLSDSPNNDNGEDSSNVVIVQYRASPALNTIPSDPFEGLSDMERLTDLESNHSQWEIFTDRSTSL